jgi:hypothetical protein
MDTPISLKRQASPIGNFEDFFNDSTLVEKKNQLKINLNKR